MAENNIKTNYVKFGRNERHLAEIFDKKQNNKNLANNKKEEPPKEEIKTSNFVDRSAQLNASLNSLALSNMVNLQRFEKNQKSKIDNFIDEKSEIKTEIFNPFAQKAPL